MDQMRSSWEKILGKRPKKGEIHDPSLHYSLMRVHLSSIMLSHTDSVDLRMVYYGLLRESHKTRQ